MLSIFSVMADECTDIATIEEINFLPLGRKWITC